MSQYNIRQTASIIGNLHLKYPQQMLDIASFPATDTENIARLIYFLFAIFGILYEHTIFQGFIELNHIRLVSNVVHEKTGTFSQQLGVLDHIM